MPAGLPGATLAQNQANPAQGPTIIMDPLSGPKGTKFDARTITGWVNGYPTYAADAGNVSTGGLCTGIGFGSPPIFGANDPAPFADGNFTDNYIPGRSLPSAADATDSTLVYIGGGRSNVDGTPNPYDELNVPLCMAGNGASRDAGTAGFCCKSVTATGAVANGAAVETGFLNRSGVALVTGQSVFGSATNANTTPA